MTFSKNIKQFVDDTNEANLKVFRGTALSMFGKIVLRTPVDTGRLRGNWNSSINVSPNGAPKSGYESLVFKAKIGDSIYFVNNLPYAEVIENGDTGRRPHGMVKNTVNEFQAVVKRMVRKFKV